MALQLGTMLIGLLLVIVTGLWGLNGQRVDFGVATSGYRQLRSVYEVAGHAATAKTFLLAGNTDLAAMEMDRAVARLDMFANEEQAESNQSALALAQSLKSSIGQAAQLLRPSSSTTRPSTRQQLDALDRVLGQVTGFALDLRKSITDHESAAHDRWRTTLSLLVGVSLAVTLLMLWLGVRQYQNVVNPLQRLRQVADRFASGKLDERLDVKTLARSGTEFGRLADDFNRMARDLQSLYDDLEQQVQSKSRELVRSERLASVGYLAAGIAHEINNPLGIITGYAERTIRQLERQTDRSAVTIAMRNLSVVCEEAFRCKAITDRLLSLVRPGEEQQKPVELNGLVQEVATLVHGLPLWHRQNVRLKIEPVGGALLVAGAAAELKQVLLNLLINACEADAKQVLVKLEQAETSAQIVVSDNGRGMSAETLEHVFEPFFTEKRGNSGGAGTGLGLSISHAIIENHGGRLTAASDGPKCGSRFVIELPLATETPVTAVSRREMP